MTAVLLHGFWGQPSDWNAVLNGLPLGMPVIAPDLYAPGPLAPTTKLNEWPDKFWHQLEHEIGGAQVTLVGYSMGARLAMCAVRAKPERVKRALFISGRPWLPAEDVEERAEWEKRFCEDFQRLEWTDLEAKWQDQSVFSGSAPLPRRKSPELREVLGLSLTNWSPRLQPFGEAELKALPATMDWAFGANDQNYLGIAKDLQDLPVKGQITLVPHAGHRIITEAADFVSRWISRE